MTPITRVFVFKQTQQASAKFMGAFATGTSTFAAVELVSDGSWRAYNNYSGSGGTIKTSAGGLGTTWHVAVACWNGESSWVNLDGTKITGAFTNTQSQAIETLGSGGSGSSPATFDLAWYQCWQRQLADADVTLLRDSLRAAFPTLTLP